MAASYNISTRLINEAGYELYTLEPWRTKKTSNKSNYRIRVNYRAYRLDNRAIRRSSGNPTRFNGSKMDSWQLPTRAYLEVNQMLSILLLSVVFRNFGTIYPAVKSLIRWWRRIHRELNPFPVPAQRTHLSLSRNIDFNLDAFLSNSL